MTSPGFRLPEHLDPEEERAILWALERYFLPEHPRSDAWTLAGRVEQTGYGALQARRGTDGAWRSATRMAFARRGSNPMQGRADAR